MNYEEFGSGPKIVVLIHGWRRHAATWRRLAVALAARGYHCYAVDLPGSRGPRLSHSFTLDDYADSVERFMLTHSVREPVIIGHSFGGKVATMLAVRGSASKLVLIATNLGLARSTPYQRMVRVFLTAGLDPVMRETFNKTHLTFSTTDLERITVPVAIIHGRFDPVVSYRQAIATHRALPASSLYVCYPALHRPHVEHQAHVMRLLDQFIES